MPMKLRCHVQTVGSALAAFFVPALVAWLGGGCTSTNIHDTAQAKSKGCVDCHRSAYDEVQTPVHVGVYADTCGDCHSTKAWIPTSGGHPEDKFPITTGSHANAAIGCNDCHIPSLGVSSAGQNTNCIDCHIGAHRTPAIDGVHTAVTGYTPSSESAPHSCLAAGCHPSG